MRFYDGKMTAEEVDRVDPDGEGSHQRCLMAMFQVDLDNYDNLESLLMVHMHQQRGDILDMEYWAFEMKLTKLIDRLKKEEERNKGAQSQADSTRGPDPSKQAERLMKGAQIPKPPAIKMPNVRFPR